MPKYSRVHITQLPWQRQIIEMVVYQPILYYFLCQYSPASLTLVQHVRVMIVPSPTCPCGEEDQTTEHVLQRCNKHQPERIAQWPSATPLHHKLYGSLEDLKKTTNITAAGLVVQVNEKKKKKFNMLILPVLPVNVRHVGLDVVLLHIYQRAIQGQYYKVLYMYVISFSTIMYIK